MRYQLNTLNGVFYVRRPQATANLVRSLQIENPSTTRDVAADAARWLHNLETSAHIYGIAEAETWFKQEDMPGTLVVIDDGRPVVDDHTYEQED